MSTFDIIRNDVLEACLGQNIHGQYDAVLADPPYGISFMGKGWDRGVPSVDVWLAVGELLRPGGHMALFGGTRTSHRLAVAVEDAGFEIRDTLMVWVYGSGWPKPANVSKFIDKKLGQERPVVGEWHQPGRGTRSPGQRFGITAESGTITVPSSPDAERFEGYHAALKPAHEPCILAREPLDGELANNALVHGVAGLNIDGCRIGTGERFNKPTGATRTVYQSRAPGAGSVATGRWPTNVILTCDETICGPGNPRAIQHQPGCHVYELDRQSGVRKSGEIKATHKRSADNKIYGGVGPNGRASNSFGPSVGGASRFFYTAKVSRAERGVSAHPCMKPIELCTHVARLLLPPPRADGQPRRILVPFSGSGSEMIGALAAGWDEVVGIEYDASCNNPGKRPDYWADVAEHRIRKWLGSLRAQDIKPDVADGHVQLGLLSLIKNQT